MIDTPRRTIGIYFEGREIWCVVFLRDLRPIIDPVAWTSRPMAETWAGLVDANASSERKLDALTAYTDAVVDLSDEQLEAVALMVESALPRQRAN